MIKGDNIMKLVHISTITLKGIKCCSETLTNVAEHKTVKCPKCGSVYKKDGTPLLKVESVNGVKQIVI